METRTARLGCDLTAASGGFPRRGRYDGGHDSRGHAAGQLRALRPLRLACWVGMAWYPGFPLDPGRKPSTPCAGAITNSKSPPSTTPSLVRSLPLNDTMMPGFLVDRRQMADLDDTKQTPMSRGRRLSSRPPNDGPETPSATKLRGSFGYSPLVQNLAAVTLEPHPSNPLPHNPPPPFGAGWFVWG